MDCLLKHVIEWKIEGSRDLVKGRQGRRHKQILDDLKETRGYWKVKEEALATVCGELPLEAAVDLSVTQTAEGIARDGCCWFVDQCSLLAAFLIQGFACCVFLTPYSYFSFNPLKTKRRLIYLKAQFVPRSKHFSFRLEKPVNVIRGRRRSLFWDKYKTHTVWAESTIRKC